MTNPLVELSFLGQSVWYDNLGRELLRSGMLGRLVHEDGVRGVTSNPTIFQKAISSEKTYDNDLHVLVDQGRDVEAIYESLAIEDIREAADLLKGVYDETSGMDGYVSLEVSPRLAYDTAGTLEQVRRLFELVNRKNLMIKVPATPQGLLAVKDLIASGININITLIFSLEQYLNAAMAYVEGMEEWVASGGNPGQIASVASFFVSRVDSMVDERLEEITDPNFKSLASELVGKAAIANAKMAYALFKEIFYGERFASLKSRGARPQRVLWASTSTKNPSYPDTYYVDPLIGQDTVNTMPHVTLEAYKDHGTPAVRIEEGVDEAREVFGQLEAMGINIGEIMDQLLENGVKAFADSYDMLLKEIEKKRTRLLRGWGHRSASLGALQPRVDATLARLDADKTTESLWTGDTALWAGDPDVRSAIGQRLGWLQAVETMIGEKQRLKDFADEIRSSGFTTAVLLGMGGSSLASEVFADCFGAADGYLDLKVLDTTVPGTILDVDRNLDLKRTLFIVSSKSGGTIEVMSLYKYFRARMEQALGPDAGKSFIAITDPGTGLGKMASEHGFRRVFLNPPNIGGRFSALSYFGLVPAALIGMELDRFLMRAAQAVEASGPEVPSLESPGTWLGVIMGELALADKDKLTLIISPALSGFGTWLEQLVAESTGKEGRGVIPVAGEPVGHPDAYGHDRLFVYSRLDGDTSYDEHISALEKSGQPVVTQRLHSAYDIGREMFRWEFATAVAGAILKVNPFDEPNVQESKDITKRLLEAYKKENKIPDGEKVAVGDPGLTSALGKFVASIKPADYVAINAFIRPRTENIDILQAVREEFRDKFKVATTLGFGPRYLHSTGQIHKGGPDKGVYILVTSEDEEDVPIPGEPYSFSVLKSAQSIGDYEALKNKGRRIIRVHLGKESELKGLLNAVRVAG
ncbi:MAG: bifunctional transaldolase/phosoglucose isomerase [Desulfomonile tiedjei]|nr:bifunctional transaldolase/phosoglucose isomerase [Desulfomonile tiedjei]